ncbi:hypothetical protein ACA910_014385 [Epithemia clementina (nom. ined.)]
MNPPTTKKEDHYIAVTADDPKNKDNDNPKDKNNHDDDKKKGQQPLSSSSSSSILPPNKHSNKPNDPDRLAPFNPTNDHTLHMAMELLFGSSSSSSSSSVSDGGAEQQQRRGRRDEILFDLGSGDGRVVLQAAQHPAVYAAIGIETNPLLVQRAQQRALELGLTERQRVQFRHENVLDALHERRDSSQDRLTVWDDATALYLYLLPAGIRRLVPYLQQLVQHKIQQKQQGERQQQQQASLQSLPNQEQENDLPKNNNNNNNNNNNKILVFQVVACTFAIPCWEPVRVERTGKSGCIVTYHYQFYWEPPQQQQQQQPTAADTTTTTTEPLEE